MSATSLVGRLHFGAHLLAGLVLLLWWSSTPSSLSAKVIPVAYYSVPDGNGSGPASGTTPATLPETMEALFATNLTSSTEDPAGLPLQREAPVPGSMVNDPRFQPGLIAAIFEVNLTGATQQPLTVPASLSSLSPSSAVAGGPGFTLAVNGSGFELDSVVLWNNRTRTTAYVSDKQLTAAIPASDIAVPTTAQVTVLTPPFLFSNALTFTVEGSPQLSLQPSSLSFQVQLGAGNPPAQTLQISNSGGGTLSWTAQASTQSGGNWLAVAPASGTAPSVVSVSVNVTGLMPATYQGAVTVQALQATPFTQTVAVTLTVQPFASIQLSVQPASLSFQVVAGTGNPQPQTLLITNTGGSSLTWTAQASTQGGGNWLSVSPTRGSTPTLASVRVDVTSLAPSTYRGTVSVQASQASPPTQTVAVELTVQPSLPAQLALDPLLLNFEIPLGAGNPLPQALRISNAGGGTLSWTVQSSTVSGGPWLVVAPTSGTASAISPGIVQVIANAAALTAGVYSGSLRVESSTTGDTRTVTVALLVSQVTRTILVSQSGLLFTGVEGGAEVPSQSFGVLNTGQGAMNWTATVVSGGNWLSVSPASDTSVANSLEIPLVDVLVNVSNLRAGQHSGLIGVESAGASNSPQFVSVDLTVLPPMSNPGALVRPTGLIFAAQAGATSPAPRTVRLATATPGSVEARGILGTFDGADWLDAAPRGTSLSPTNPRTINIQARLGSLAAGIYRGGLTFLFSDSTLPQVVNILFLVVPPATGTLSDGPATGLETAQSCLPQRLFVVDRGFGSSFTSSVSWPTRIEVEVNDNCGKTVPNAARTAPATVISSFSNGDPPLALVHIGSGIYQNSWQPAKLQVQITVTVRANLPPLQPAEVALQGRLLDNPTAAAVNTGGVVNAASFARGAPLAPGSIISVFGRNLAASSSEASALPLPKTLAGATLSVGGLDAPLFFSSAGQINAQLPFGLLANSRPQVVVKARRDATAAEIITVPETITLAAARPGIFTMKQDGTGQGAILNLQGKLVDSAAPAAAGEAVQVFATGLGATNPTVPAGERAPDPPGLARVVTEVKARVGGRDARVFFAGLAPGFTGLYQVNVEIPSGVARGSAVELVLLQNDVPSNAVTIAVQ